MDYLETMIVGPWQVIHRSNATDFLIDMRMHRSSILAYVVFSHLGFYPVAGQDTYLLNRPYFPKITIHNEVTGASATILATNFGGGNNYIQSATLNGKAYTKNWISHDLFLNGGTLELVMGPGKDSTWGTGKDDLPPSLSTGGFAN